MADYWLDGDSFIRPKNEAFPLDTAPGYWAFITECAKEGVLASSIFVYHELVDKTDDDLARWAHEQQPTGLFREPSAEVQARYREVADYVEGRFPAHHARLFLDGADGWLIAHAAVEGGVVVTFEKPAPLSQKPKIPDVASQFGVECINLWRMLQVLGFKVQ